MVDVTSQAPVQTAAAATPSARRYYVLGLLTIIYALNFLDRTIFNVLIEPIKKEFSLSDTMMGLLAGFGFALFYSLLGIPIARVADRLNRRNIVALAFAFWSAMTALCGMASSVTALALARIGVGIGESAGSPASQSIVADLFAKNERPRALGIYAIGTYLGVFLGYFVGGYVNQHYGWRMAFYVAGVPGILLALILWLTISEPKRGAMAGKFRARAARADAALPGLAAELHHRADRLLPHHLYELCDGGLDPAVPGARAPSVERRDRHLCRHLQGARRHGRHPARRLRGGQYQPPRRPLEAVGAGDHLGPRRPRLCAVHADAGFFDDGRHAGADLVPGRLPSRADLCDRADGGEAQHARARLRADRVTATCFGQGVGPLAVGVVNDALKGSYGADAVRYSLLSAAVTTTLGALLFVWAARTIRADIKRAS